MSPLLLVGASVRAAAFAAARAGIPFVAADLFNDSDLQALTACYHLSFAEYTSLSSPGFQKWLNFLPAPPVAWLYTGGMENHPQAIGDICQRWPWPLWGNEAAVLQAVRDPFRLQRLLTQAGFAFPETRSLTDTFAPSFPLRTPPLGDSPATADELAGQWLLKARVSAGGAAHRLENERGFLKSPSLDTCFQKAEKEKITGKIKDFSPFLACQQTGSPRENWFPGEENLALSPGWYWQRWEAGLPCAAVYVVGARQSILWGVTRQFVGERFLGLNGPGDCRYAGSLGPLPLAPSLEATLQHLGQHLTAVFGLRGLFGVDFLLQGPQLPAQDTLPLQGRVMVIEVNPRYPASAEVLERGGGGSALAAHARCFADLPLTKANGRMPSPFALAWEGERKPSQAKVVAKGILFARHRCRLSPTACCFDLASWGPAGLFADVPAPDTFFAAGDPMLTLFAQGDDLASTENLLRQRVDVFYRRNVVTVPSE